MNGRWFAAGARTKHATLGQRFDEGRVLHASAPAYDELSKIGC
jgi:hypothetical protein